MHLFVGKFCSNLGIDLYLQLFDVQNMLLELSFCGAHYFIIHHFVTIQNHKYVNHMLELCKEVSNDSILDDSDNCHTCLGDQAFQFRSFCRTTEFRF